MALEEVDDRIVETFEESEITGPDWDISEIGLIRPTATWTYMVHDNPFGTEAERFFTALAKFAVNRR